MKKTSQSKKVMKMLDKERRKKKKHESHGSTVSSKNGHDCEPSNDDDLKPSSIADNDPVNKKRPKDANPDPSTHTEIRTDDFVVRSLYVNFTFHESFSPFYLKTGLNFKCCRIIELTLNTQIDSRAFIDIRFSIRSWWLRRRSRCRF